jgi:hypothetical protein
MGWNQNLPGIGMAGINRGVVYFSRSFQREEYQLVQEETGEKIKTRRLQL